MTKDQKLKYIDDLIKTVKSWRSFWRPAVENFIIEAKVKIGKIDGKESNFVKDIDVLSDESKVTNVDYKEQMITVLNLLRFKIETDDENSENVFDVYNVHCNICNHETRHSIVAKSRQREIITELVGIQEIDFWQDKNAQILKCNNCNEFSLRKFDIWCEDFPNFKALNEQILPLRLVKSIEVPKSFKNVPTLVLLIYGETIEAYYNNLNLLCAGGLRTIIEAICKDKGIKGEQLVRNGKNIWNTDLEGKINGLYHHGLITLDHKDILQKQRFLGVRALHFIEKPSKEELLTAIEIIAITLNTIYELRSKADEFNTRNESRKTKDK